MSQRTSFIAALAALVATCALPLAGYAQQQAQDKSILVFAAASMKNALDEVDATFAKQTGIAVVASYDASSALMKQIEQGAPADVYISADQKWMDYGSQKQLIDDTTRGNLLGNTLVLIASKESKLSRVTMDPNLDLAALAGAARIATGDVRAVPVGIYAKAGDGRQCPRRARIGRARRGAARHRLRDRCQSGAGSEDRRRLSRRLPSADRLSGRGHPEGEAGGDALSFLSALGGGAGDLRALRL